MSGLLREVWSDAIPTPVGTSGPARLALSPAGERLAVGTERRNSETGADVPGSLTVYRLDSGSGTLEWRTTEEAPVLGVHFSPDGQRLVVVQEPNNEKCARVLNTADGRETGRYTERRMRTARFSPDGSVLVAVCSAAAGSAAKTTIRVVAVDPASGRELWTFGPQRVSGLDYEPALSPDSQTVASPTRDGILVIDVRSGQHRVLTATPARTLAYSADGQQLVASDSGGELTVMDATDGRQLWSATVAPADAPFPTRIDVSGDGRWVSCINASAGRLNVFNLATGQPRFTAPTVAPGSRSAAVFSPQLRQTSIVEGGRLVAFDARTGTRERSTPENGPQFSEFAYTTDGDYIAACSDDGARVGLYDVGSAVSTFDTEAAITALAMSPTRRPLVAVGDAAPGVTVVVADQGTALARKPIPGTLTAINFANRGESVVAAGSAIVLLFSVVGDRQWKTDSLGTVNALAVGGADDDWIAVTSGKTASLLATSDGHPRWANPAAHPRAVTRIAIDRGGRWVATGCADRRTRLFDAATGELTHETEARLGGVLALGTPVDGSIVVSANEDGEVLLIDTANPASHSRSIPGNFACRHVEISSDGTLLAIGRDDNSVAIHDIAVAGEPPLLQRWTYPAPVTALAFAPDCDVLAVATDTTGVALTDARTGTDLCRLHHPSPVTGLAFSADGALIATASDHTVRVRATGITP